jgi:curved DNA-binding protein CbpA
MMVLSKEDFHRLTPKQLAQIYRKRALECHPDQGGSHEQFIRLTRAYRDLLLRKRPLPQ